MGRGTRSLCGAAALAAACICGETWQTQGAGLYLVPAQEQETAKEEPFVAEDSGDVSKVYLEIEMTKVVQMPEPSVSVYMPAGRFVQLPARRAVIEVMHLERQGEDIGYRKVGELALDEAGRGMAILDREDYFFFVEGIRHPLYYHAKTDGRLSLVVYKELLLEKADFFRLIQDWIVEKELLQWQYQKRYTAVQSLAGSGETQTKEEAGTAAGDPGLADGQVSTQLPEPAVQADRAGIAAADLLKWMWGTLSVLLLAASGILLMAYRRMPEKGREFPDNSIK